MQVIEFKEFGSPSQLGLAERPLPQANANTAVVRIEAAAVNPSDVKNVAGRCRRQPFPAYPGGIIPAWWWTAQNSGSTKRVGYVRRCGFTRDGSHTEYIQVPVASLVRKPERLSYIEAGAWGDLCNRVVRP